MSYVNSWHDAKTTEAHIRCTYIRTSHSKGMHTCIYIIQARIGTTGPYADSQMGGGSCLQNVEHYLLTGEYLQMQSCAHRFVHKQLLTPSAQQSVKQNMFALQNRYIQSCCSKLRLDNDRLVSQHLKLVKMGRVINNFVFLRGSCCFSPSVIGTAIYLYKDW